jgi:hypothetical protein
MSSDKPEDSTNSKKAEVHVTSNPTLPSKDIAEIVTDNKQVPKDVRLRHWGRDLPSVSLSKLGAEDRRRLRVLAEIREDIRQQYEQAVYVYVPGIDLQRENNDLDFDLPFNFAMTKADNENDTPLIDKLLSSSTLVETRHGETKKTEEQPSKGRRLLGIVPY